LDADRNDFRQSINVLDAIYWVSTATINVRPETVKKCFLRSGFRHRGIKVTDVDDQFTPTEELGNLIKLIDNNTTENEHISLDDCVETYDTDINDSTNMSTLNEVESEEDETQDQENDLTLQIGSLRETLAAAKSVRKYISSINTQNTSLFYNAVELENASIHEITMQQRFFK